jgi:hypothetical protein
MIKGDIGTVLTVIKRLFAPVAVGVLNSNNKVTFGLETKHNKELLIAHEIGDRLTDRQCPTFVIAKYAKQLRLRSQHRQHGVPQQEGVQNHGRRKTTIQRNSSRQHNDIKL